MDQLSEDDQGRSDLHAFYVYVDWTRDEVPMPFYVGKGKLNRVQQRKRSLHHSRIVAKHGLDRRIVPCTSETEAFEHEMRLIAEHHTFVYDSMYNGIGCNHTIGGDGSSGRVPSLETRQKMARSISTAMIGNRNAFGCSRTDEQREKIRQTLLGHEVPIEVRKKISDSLLGKKHSAESIKRSADGHRGLGKAVEQRLGDVVIATFASAVLAQASTGICRSKICECCKGRRKQAGGFKWSYKK